MCRAALLAILISTAPAWAETAYFDAIDDLPMPGGFVQLDAGFAFTGGAGRIVSSCGLGPDGAGIQARDFYMEVLPQLGWAVAPQQDGALIFQRGRERLAFTVEPAAERTKVCARLVVTPAPRD